MSDALSPRVKKKFASYSPRERGPQEALPPGISVWQLPRYKPEPAPAVRPGADDHQRIRSRGMPT